MLRVGPWRPRAAQRSHGARRVTERVAPLTSCGAERRHCRIHRCCALLGTAIVLVKAGHQFADVHFEPRTRDADSAPWTLFQRSNACDEPLRPTARLTSPSARSRARGLFPTAVATNMLPTKAAPRNRCGRSRKCSRQSVAASTLSSSSLRFEPRRSRVRSMGASISLAVSSIRDSP